MAGHPAQAGEASAADAHGEVPPLARARMAGVQVTVIDHLQGQGSECSDQDLFQRGGAGCGGQGFAWWHGASQPGLRLTGLTLI